MILKRSNEKRLFNFVSDLRGKSFSLSLKKNVS